jgi:hypothetical protein
MRASSRRLARPAGPLGGETPKDTKEEKPSRQVIY